MLAVYLFLIVLASQTVAWVGQSKLSQLAFQIYLAVASPSAHRRQSLLRKEVFKAKSELQGTSSQDEFAKWARLRRKLDKEVAELEKTTSDLAAMRTKFIAAFTSILWIGTTGLQILVVYLHRSAPVFFLPQHWFPPLVNWALSLPNAPAGAVSAAVWCMACRRTLGLTAQALATMQPLKTPTPG